MILIEADDFRMEQVKTSPFFDLKMPAIINKGKTSERTELKVIGYSMPFETCLQHIVAHRMAELDETYSVSEYVDIYIQEVSKICDLVKYIIVETPVEEEEESTEVTEEEITEE
ncbi:MAG: hypothetical protein ACOH2V_00725 [Candidatus Saccharimonadaceae bacterium]